MKRGGGSGKWKSGAPLGLSVYEVSEFGEVRRTVNGKTRSKEKRPKGIIKDGYHCYKLMHDDGSKFNIGTHHLVLLLFVGPRPSPQHQGAHNNGKSWDNHYKNLRWATNKQNHADRVAHGTDPKGSRNGRAILTEDKVIQLRAAFAREHPKAKLKYGQVKNLYQQLERQYGVKGTAIRDAVTGHHWGHV